MTIGVRTHEGTSGELDGIPEIDDIEPIFK